MLEEFISVMCVSTLILHSVFWCSGSWDLDIMGSLCAEIGPHDFAMIKVACPRKYNENMIKKNTTYQIKGMCVSYKRSLQHE